MIGVSVLIPSDDGDQYLLKVVQGRGWWLIHGSVGADRTAKSTAQRIATEVRRRFSSVVALSGYRHLTGIRYRRTKP